MKNNLLRSLLIAAVALSPLALSMSDVKPANAQVIVNEEFRTALAPYGSWEHSRHWGDVWIPAQLPQQRRPYTVGHWIYTNELANAPPRLHRRMLFQLHVQPDPRCQSAPNRDPLSACKRDPFERRVRAVALAPSELVGVAETARARVVG